MNMKKLRCDKPYDIDEARKRKGLSRRKRKDSRTTAYELTIRIPEEYRTYFDGKKKLTRTVRLEQERRPQGTNGFFRGRKERRA